MSALADALLHAARAADALAVSFDIAADSACVVGRTGAHGLPEAEALTAYSDFLGHVAPADRRLLAGLGRSERTDCRIRLIGGDGKVRYARLIGRGAESGFTGLLLPAGRIEEDGADAIDREEALRAGLAAGEVIAFHQPIIDLQTERLAGFEALARWRAPDGPVQSPDDFFTLANRLNLMGAIGDSVRGAAVADLSAWRAARPDLKRLFVSANATVSELTSPGFTDRLIALVGEAGLPWGGFKLEISETEVMRDPEGAQTVLVELKKAGIALALDDFGTGYSSLARLDRLPFDVIKIDQYFVRAMLADGSARAITASVVKLARSLGMAIVAEGVESAETADLLAEMGCDYAQGFLYAGALPPERAEQTLREGKPGLFGPPV